MLLAILTVGINHQTAPVEVRERLAFAEDEVVNTLLRLKEQVRVVSEAALLSTCNRVELIAVSDDVATAESKLIEFLSLDRGVARGTFEPALYRLEGRDAVRHLFRDGSNLDSMVVC